MFIYAGNISGLVYEKLVYVFLQEDTGELEEGRRHT